MVCVCVGVWGVVGVCDGVCMGCVFAPFLMVSLGIAIKYYIFSHRLCHFVSYIILRDLLSKMLLHHFIGVIEVKALLTKINV